MSLTQDQVNQLQQYVNSGNAAGYYNLLNQYGHQYGNLAYGAATDSGFWGQYANNFLELKAAEYGVNLDRNKLMQELMEADFVARQEAGWEPITTDTIREYHHDIFFHNATKGTEYINV